MLDNRILVEDSNILACDVFHSQQCNVTSHITLLWKPQNLTGVGPHCYLNPKIRTASA